MADVADERVERGRIVGDQARFHILAEQLAQQASEVFVPWIRKETPRIREHAHELGQQAERRERVDLPLHAFLLVEEPPAGAKLQPARHGAVLKIAHHRGEDVVVGRVQVVEHDPRQRVFAVQRVKVARERAGLREVADRVHAGIGTAPLEQAAVVVSQRAEMDLFCPPALRIESAEEHHDEPLPLRGLDRRRGQAGARLREDRGSLRRRAIGVGQALQAVIRKAAAHGMEKRVAAVQRVEQGVERVDLHLGPRGERLAPRVEHGGRGDGHELIGAVGGIDLCLEIGRRDGDVVFQRVGGVVGRAHDRHAIGGEDTAGRESRGRQFRVGQFPDARRIGLVDQQVDFEEATQLQVRPMVQRVAHELRHDATVGEELVVVGRSGTRDEVLVDPRRAHRAPLVVIAREPHLVEIAELLVGRDLVGRQVAVVVVDRLRLGDVVIEPPRRRGREQEVFVEKGRHGGRGGRGGRAGGAISLPDSPGCNRSSA